MNRLFAVIVSFSLILGLTVTGHAQVVEKPPLSTARIAGEVLAGATGGFALACVGWWIGGDYPPIGPDESRRLSDDRSLILYVSGFGSIAGVYMIGELGDETGSFLATFGGSVIGLFVGALVLWGLELKDVSEAVAIGQFFVSPSIAAAIAFNLTRRYDSTPKTALINLRDGQMSPAIPRVYLRPDSSGKGNLSQNVDLLRIGF